nr:hypothetical protein Iba_chr03fCG4180 [Ipomoea batatas]
MCCFLLGPWQFCCTMSRGNMLGSFSLVYWALHLWLSVWVMLQNNSHCIRDQQLGAF